MTPPPARLDGAEVLFWMARERPLYSIDDGGVARGVVAMAVAQYPRKGSEKGNVYLFKCDAGWDVIGDSDCESVEEAMVRAAGCGVRHDEWKRAG